MQGQEPNPYQDPHQDPSLSPGASPERQAVAAVISLFEGLQPADIARLGEFYSADAYFKDPCNEVRGPAGVDPRRAPPASTRSGYGKPRAARPVRGAGVRPRAGVRRVSVRASARRRGTARVGVRGSRFADLGRRPSRPPAVSRPFGGHFFLP